MSNKANNTMKNKAKHTLTPKLRFPEFRREPGWAETPLDACLDYQQPTPYLVSDTNYSPSFKTPVLTAGKTFVLGYTNEQHGIFTGPLPVIIFDDFTTATQFVDFPFKAKSSAMKILQAKNEANIKFMYETLQTLSFEVGAHERHWISTFAPMMVYVPKPAEQSKIAACLGSLDDWIAAEGRTLEAIKAHKKGLMQQLFPQPGQTRPRLRFPEFRKAGQWEEKPFENLYDFKPNNTYSREQLNYEHGTVKNIHYGDIHTRFSTHFHINAEKVPFVDAKVLPNDLNPESLCRPGDVIFADASEDLADVGKCIEIVNVGDERVLSGSHTILARPRSQSLVVGFGGYLFKSRSTRAGIEKEAQGTKVMQISPKRLATIQVFFPSDAHEQQAIVACLTALDTRITAQATKIAALKTHKRGLMQQLFPSPEDN